MLSAMDEAALLASLEDDTLPFAYSSSSEARSTSPVPSVRPGPGQLPDAWRRPRSPSLSVSSLDSGSAEQPVSCVTREIAISDCATQRFILWAAVRRNDCRRMTEDERLECPLLRCTRRFNDHETMLRHLVACDFLPSCEYWCYDHMRIERFDDSRCQKGPGHPSKRRKMLSVAKKFISSLSHHNAGKAAADPDSLVSPSSASISDSNVDDLPYASASLVSLFTLNGSSSITRSLKKGSNSVCGSNSSKRSSHIGNQSSSPSSSRRSVDRRFSVVPADAKRSSKLSPHSTRPEAVTYAELPSTEIVELDSKEICAVQRSFSSPVPSPCPRISAIIPVGMVSSGLISDMPSAVPSTTAFAPSVDPASKEAPVLSPASPTSSTSPMLFCPTPSVSSGAAYFGEPTIDPVQLVLPDHHSASALQENLMEWELSKASTPLLGGMPSVAIPMDNAYALPAVGFDPASTNTFYSLSDVHAGTNLPSTSYQPGSSMHSELFGQPFAVSPIPSPSPRPPRPTSTAPRSKNLSPSSSVRSTTSNASTMTTASTASTATTATTISDVSDVSDIGFLNLNMLPECGPASWLPVDLSSSTIATDNMDPAEFLDNSYFDILSVLEETSGSGPPSMSSTPLVDGTATGGLLPIMPNNVQEPSAFVEIPVETVDKLSNASFSLLKLDDDDGHGEPTDALKDMALDVNGLAVSAWGLLPARIAMSSRKLRDFDATDNALAAQLKKSTLKQIVDVGFAALQSVLMPGDNAVSSFSMLCLLHLVFALSSVTCETEAVARSKEVFSHSLAYSAHYASPDKENYLEVASLIWQPGDLTPVSAIEEIRLSTAATSRERDVRFLDDVIARTTREFLNDLKISAVLGSTSPAGVTAIDPGDRQAAEEFVFSVNDVLQELSRDYASEHGLLSSFQEISQRATSGALKSVRQLEIELIRAGKGHLSFSGSFLDGYICRTRALCDNAFAKHASQQLVHYDGRISLLRSLFAAVKDAALSPPSTTPKSMSPDCLLDDLLTDFDLGSDDGEDQESKLDTPSTTVLSDTQNSVATSYEKQPFITELSASKSMLAAKKKTPLAVGDKCSLCNYRPKGDPEWFQGSMAKHMINKHSEDAVYYVCSVPGCKSRYRNREDNLRQHERKVHGLGEGKKRLSRPPVSDHDEAVAGRAPKRRKTER